jgi:hypothetical protein
MRLLAAVAACMVACGSRQPKNDRVDPDPAWAHAYEQRAADGCACKDATCMTNVRAELANLEAEHGGMDDAPPGVQKAHGEFDKCWRDATKDPARDLAALADQVCACEDRACLQQARIDEMHLAGKYEVDDISDVAAMSAAAGDAYRRANKCIADVTIAADAFIAIVEKSATDLCDCKNLGCAQTVIKARIDALSKYLAIADEQSIQDRLDAAQPKFCKCFGELVTKEMANTLFGGLPVKIDATINCK